MSRRISARVLGGRGMPSGVRSVSIRSDASRSVGLKLRIPRRMRHAFIRLTMLVCWLRRFSRSRFGRPGILFIETWDCRHLATVRFAA